jgi:hypothetical protein
MIDFIDLPKDIRFEIALRLDRQSTYSFFLSCRKNLEICNEHFKNRKIEEFEQFRKRKLDGEIFNH